MKEKVNQPELGELSVTALGKFVYVSKQPYCATADHYLDCVGVDFVFGAGDFFIHESDESVNYHLN